MTSFQELQQLIPKLPEAVKDDIANRVSDWLLSGGDTKDSYIAAQLRYAKAVLQRLEEKVL